MSENFKLARYSTKTAWTLPILLGTLLLWGELKIGWEEKIEQRQNLLRPHSIFLSNDIADQLGQGALLGVLGGLRAVVANYFWLQIPDAWEDHAWYRVKTLVNLVTALQPYSPLFWEMGGWQLAWNASADKLSNPQEKSATRRIADARFWSEEGRAFLKRGTDHIPNRYQLWVQRALLEEQQFHNYEAAAHFYEEALKQPGAPRYLERFVGYDLERGGNLPEAYTWWRTLWLSTPDHDDATRSWDKVEYHLRDLENQLTFPSQERIFPVPSPSPSAH